MNLFNQVLLNAAPSTSLSWHDKICNGELQQIAKMESVETILVKRQLRWADHIVRMPDDRLPKPVMYAELTEGQRKRRWGQKLRYMDVLKRHLKTADIDTDSWESQASDRATWKKKVYMLLRLDWKRKEKYLDEWRKRHPSHFRQLYAIIVKLWAANDDDS